jgi:deoxycytidylate deaminase
MNPGAAKQAPELFLGLAGAIGTDLDLVTNKLSAVLTRLGYESRTIHLAALLSELPDVAPKLIPTPYDKYIHSHMNEGDSLRKKTARNDALALLGVANIQKQRQESGGSFGAHVVPRAYILRSLKHPDEAQTLREIYGDSFYLIAAYAPHDLRRDHLAERIARSNSDSSPNKYLAEAERLISRDLEEADLPHGQKMRDTYHRADVFVDTTEFETLTKSVERFVELIFGNTLHTPTRDEYAMFHARGAALRSSELGRQVGAAIVRDNGDIVAVGTNEVPKAGGGLYWCGDKPDMREFVRGFDSNDAHKRTLIADTLKRLIQKNWLEPKLAVIDLESLVNKAVASDSGPLDAQSMIRNVIEFGRAVHAEMAAIVDSARRGVGISECTMFVTTFPCHLCARHVVAAGIKKLIYIEPYPKSLAAELYPDSISVDNPEGCSEQVLFKPFVGVAPRQYMRLFHARDRKDKEGKAIPFNPATALPRFSASERLYRDNEDLMLRNLGGILSRQGLLFREKLNHDGGDA